MPPTQKYNVQQMLDRANELQTYLPGFQDANMGFSIGEFCYRININSHHFPRRRPKVQEVLNDITAFRRFIRSSGNKSSGSTSSSNT